MTSLQICLINADIHSCEPLTLTTIQLLKEWIILSSQIKAGFHMIADDRGSQIAESSAIVCDHMETHFCDRLRSCDRDRRRSQTIADDRRRSQKIEPCSIFCDRLRSSAIVCDPAIIWKPKFCDLRSKCIP